MTRHTVVVPPDLGGSRADKILSTVLDLSRAGSRAIVDAGGATVDGAAIAASDRLATGTTIEVVVLDEVGTVAADPDVPYRVAHEDRDLLVIDKPAGVVVHPTSERTQGSLVHGLLDRYPDIRGVGQEGRWGIVHRLDRSTSGLLVIARTHDAYAELVSMLKARAITRRYLAMVEGTFDHTIGTIEAPIGRDPRRPTRVRLDRSGRDARTHYRRLAGWHPDDVSLLSVTLDTGRTHQIRVHMQSIGHPIVGDVAYGGHAAGDLDRPWLHARQLTFAHPVTGDTIDVVSALPRDLADNLVGLGAPTTGDALDIDGAPL
jgi:23S rRNA pseudouridine1911/1915/1917 synthase